MKDFLLLIVGGAILVAVFADGGLTVSPTLSPALAGRLDVQYSPDQSVTTIEQHIDTLIEQQVIYQDAPAGGAGVNLVQSGAGQCPVQPGDQIEMMANDGSCFVWSNGQKYFIAPGGGRAAVTDGTSGPGLQPLATPATAPLVPAVPLTLEVLQARFLHNGGELPLLWNLRGDDFKVKWLEQRGETWR